MMRLDELKRALVEVRDFCAARDACDGCHLAKKMRRGIFAIYLHFFITR